MYMGCSGTVFLQLDCHGQRKLRGEFSDMRCHAYEDMTIIMLRGS